MIYNDEPNLSIENFEQMAKEYANQLKENQTRIEAQVFDNICYATVFLQKLYKFISDKIKNNKLNKLFFRLSLRKKELFNIFYNNFDAKNKKENNYEKIYFTKKYKNISSALKIACLTELEIIENIISINNFNDYYASNLLNEIKLNSVENVKKIINL